MMSHEAPGRASFRDIAKAAFWLILGVRKKQDHERDSVGISPVQVIAAGIIGAAAFVLTLVLVVKLVTG